MAPTFALTPDLVDARAREGLAALLPRVGLDGLLGAGAARRGTTAAPPGAAVVDGFGWDAEDAVDPRWFPQGVTTLHGPGAVGDPATPDVLLVSWYAKRVAGRTPGARVTVVDLRDPARPAYTHVLLVEPVRRLGRTGYRPVPVHAGGLAAVAGRLYVAATREGVRVFDLADVLALPGPGGEDVGRTWRGWSAAGATHVLPQRSTYRSRTAGFAPLRFSFCSVGTDDDGRPLLVAGEYGRKDAATHRLTTYPLDPATGLLAGDGPVPPTAVHEEQPPRMQGAAVREGRWWLSASTGPGNAGDLWSGEPGAWTHHRGVLPPGPEDLGWSDDGRRLWSVSEHPGERWAYRLDPPGL